MPRSIFRASVFERPRSKVVAEESNEDRISWMSHVPQRIAQDECICTEEFCSIPNNHCLGPSKCCDWSCNWPWWIVRLKSGLRWRTGRNNRTRVKCCRNVDGSQLAGASR